MARLQFPTFLRKMWTGAEVQQWLDNVNAVSAQEPGRRIVWAANRRKHRFGDVVVLGARHFDMLMRGHIRHCGITEPVEWEQGFVDQRGVFLTREEAWIVAEAAGQIIRRVDGDGIELFSENLY